MLLKCVFMVYDEFVLVPFLLVWKGGDRDAVLGGGWGVFVRMAGESDDGTSFFHCAASSHTMLPQVAFQ